DCEFSLVPADACCLAFCFATFSLATSPCSASLKCPRPAADLAPFSLNVDPRSHGVVELETGFTGENGPPGGKTLACALATPLAQIESEPRPIQVRESCDDFRVLRKQAILAIQRPAIAVSRRRLMPFAGGLGASRAKQVSIVEGRSRTLGLGCPSNCVEEGDGSWPGRRPGPRGTPARR